MDEIIDVAREELTRECDYTIEAANQQRFRSLIQDDPALRDHIIVPEVIPHLCGRQVLTSEFVPGVSVDKVAKMSQEVCSSPSRPVYLFCPVHEDVSAADLEHDVVIIDGCQVRNHVARLVLMVTVRELFVWRFMQTDPNWGNFL